jgi:hypothetical protein
LYTVHDNEKDNACAEDKDNDLDIIYEDEEEDTKINYENLFSKVDDKINLIDDIVTNSESSSLIDDSVSDSDSESLAQGNTSIETLKPEKSDVVDVISSSSSKSEDKK